MPLPKLVVLISSVVIYYQWIILAFWKIADYKAVREQNNTPYVVGYFEPLDLLSYKFM
jgi:hypothetical protein